MSPDERVLRNRFTELYKTAYSRGYWRYTEFLTMAEQDILIRCDFGDFVQFWGGFQGAERRIAFFGDEKELGYARPELIACVKLEPASQKFADKLSHRDVLGALMSLGMRREVLGDIVLANNIAYLFCLESIAGYITEQCTKVRHTTIKCAVTDDIPETITELPPESQIVISSERLDAIVAAVYGLSRGESQKLFTDKKVFVNSRLCENGAANISDSAIVSVRGFGRFIYEGILRETKKGRLRAGVRKYE